MGSTTSWASAAQPPTPSYVVLALWTIRVGDSIEVRPLLDVDGDQPWISSGSWWEGPTDGASWHGCDDFDQDGDIELATGTFEIVDDRLEWTGDRLAITDGTVTIRSTIEGSRALDGNPWPEWPSCPSAQTTRAENP